MTRLVEGIFELRKSDTTSSPHLPSKAVSRHYDPWNQTEGEDLWQGTMQTHSRRLI